MGSYFMNWLEKHFLIQFQLKMEDVSAKENLTKGYVRGLKYAIRLILVLNFGGCKEVHLLKLGHKICC